MSIETELLNPLLHVENLVKHFRVRPVSYTHLRAHETVLDLVCRLLLEKKNRTSIYPICITNTPA